MGMQVSGIYKIGGGGVDGFLEEVALEEGFQRHLDSQGIYFSI